MNGSESMTSGLPAAGGGMAPEEEEIDLLEYLATLEASRWLIAGVALVVFLVGAAYAFLAAPVYEADALIQIEEKNGGLGQLGDLGAVLTGKTPTAGEIEIMRSRSVLGAVVDDLHLDIQARPHRLPVIGDAVARWTGDDASIKVDRLNVPSGLVGKRLTLLVDEGGRYRLLDDDGMLLEGREGQPARGHGVSMFVSAIHADPGARFDVVRLDRLSVIQGLRQALQATEKGRETNIVRIAYRSTTPRLAAEIVNAVADRYLRQNVEQRSEEARKSLAFLDQQLPKVRAEVEAAEMALKEYRETHAAVDLREASKALLERLVGIQQLLSELEVKRSGLRQQFTTNHPVIAAIDAKEQRLLQQKRTLEARIRHLPKIEQELLGLMRELKVKSEVYTYLLNKAQELRVVQAGTVGNARIVDHAVIPTRPVKPKKGMIMALSLLTGLFLGVLVAFARKGLAQTIDEPDTLERELGVTVYAAIPHSSAQVEMHAAMVRRRKQHEPQRVEDNLLAARAADEGAVEALRSLRTNLHFALMDTESNIVALSGPAPGVGKSFVSANLAWVLAEGGKRVLLVDGDLRKGHLQEYLGLPRTPGLSEATSGQLPWRQAIHATSLPDLFFMPTGMLPPNPADLLMSERFSDFLREAAMAYDTVLVDTPPVLAATDAALIGRHASAFFLLVRAGRHHPREIREALRQLQAAGVRATGALLNDLRPAKGRYGYYGGYYRYAYSSKG